MDTYPAYINDRGQKITVKLVFVIVYRLVERDGGLVAHAASPDGTESYKFWVSKPSQALGSRCKVFARKSDTHPTISREKADFEVVVDTIVLLVRPHQGHSAFPVISWDDYQKSLRAAGAILASGEQPVTKKGDHRWVEAPPVPKAPHRTPPQS